MGERPSLLESMALIALTNKIEHVISDKSYENNVRSAF
jgi:hypothetical protein